VREPCSRFDAFPYGTPVLRAAEALSDLEVTMNLFAKALFLLCIWDYRRQNRKKRA
jgi:hypothetical protein